MGSDYYYLVLTTIYQTGTQWRGSLDSTLVFNPTVLPYSLKPQQMRAPRYTSQTQTCTLC